LLSAPAPILGETDDTQGTVDAGDLRPDRPERPGAGLEGDDTGAADGGLEPDLPADLVPECARWCTAYAACPTWCPDAQGCRHPDHTPGPIWDECFFSCLGSSDDASFQCRYDAKVHAACLEFHTLVGCGIEPDDPTLGPCANSWSMVVTAC
jgi:hypothetical protein